MITKHFVKTLVIFTGMIVLGLLGVFLASYFEQLRQEEAIKAAPIEEVAN